MRSTENAEIGCQQELRENTSVFSRQWTVLPSRYAGRLDPELLLERYLAHIRRATCGLVRPRRKKEDIDFLLLGTALKLLRFSSPLLRKEGRTRSAVLTLCGGLLVRNHSRPQGSLTFRCEPRSNGIKVELLLTDYRPTLLGGPGRHPMRKWLFHATQAAIHRGITVRFLSCLHRELTGITTCLRVIKIPCREGEEI